MEHELLGESSSIVHINCHRHCHSSSSELVIFKQNNALPPKIAFIMPSWWFVTQEAVWILGAETMHFCLVRDEQSKGKKATDGLTGWKSNRLGGKATQWVWSIWNRSKCLKLHANKWLIVTETSPAKDRLSGRGDAPFWFNLFHCEERSQSHLKRLPRLFI